MKTVLIYLDGKPIKRPNGNLFIVDLDDFNRWEGEMMDEIFRMYELDRLEDATKPNTEKVDFIGHLKRKA